MGKEMKPTEYTVVKTEFPYGWSETPFELLLKRLDENGFSIKETHEVAAVENLPKQNIPQQRISASSIQRSHPMPRY